MSTQHTPGPWTIDFAGKIWSTITVQLSGKDCNPLVATVAGFTTMRIEELANAKLIAAAPDLLDALQDCLPDLEHYARTHGPGPDTRLEKARAAITKATAQ